MASKGPSVAKLWTVSLVLAGLLTACAQWQRQEAQTKADFQNLQDRQRERAAYDACAERTLPGSAENLECRLQFIQKERKPSTGQ